MVIAAAILGLAIGVAVNAAADSLPVSRRLEKPHCQACGAPVPFRGWLALAAVWKGPWRCRYCGQPRPLRVLAVEAISTMGAALIYLGRSDVMLFLGSILVASFFLLIAVIDIEHRLILHPVSLTAALAIGTLGALDPGRGPVKTLAGGLAGLAIVYGMFLLGVLFSHAISRLRGRELDEVAFGFGDVTLAGVIGLAVGWPGVLVALFLGILAAGAYGMAHMAVGLVRGRYAAFSPIPYGPFLILGAVFVYFGGRQVLQGLMGA